MEKAHVTHSLADQDKDRGFHHMLRKILMWVLGSHRPDFNSLFCHLLNWQNYFRLSCRNIVREKIAKLSVKEPGRFSLSVSFLLLEHRANAESSEKQGSEIRLSVQERSFCFVGQGSKMDLGELSFTHVCPHINPLNLTQVKPTQSEPVLHNSIRVEWVSKNQYGMSPFLR